MDQTQEREIACDICFRPFSRTRRQPLCASCAQTILYQSRLQHATALLDREKHHAHAEAILRPGNDGVIAALPEDADFDSISIGVRTNSVDRLRSEQEAAECRIVNIVERAEVLKKQMATYKEHITSQKEETSRRREQLAAERTALEKYKPRAQDPIQVTTKKASQRIDKVRSRIIDARSLLCREAALAVNFHKRKAADGRTEYVLGGLVIPDLRMLNVKTHSQAKAPLVGGRTVAEPHDLISEAFDNVARLLNICTYYLSIRLPGELLLPHENFARAAIMPEKASYRFGNIKFPRLSPSQSSSPATSRVVERDRPRPRALWLDRPLGQLSKDDPKAYSLYIEGVAMLAYNVAWLSRTQGIDITNFDDICDVGRNLYRLFLQRSQPRPALDRRLTGTSTKGKDDSSIKLGVYSHNSVQHSLFSADGLRYMKGWSMGSAGRLADQLRRSLLAEISGAEWDLLEEGEWDEEREEERPVLVGGSRRPNESRHAASMSIMTVAAHDGAEEDRSSAAEGDQEKNKKGSSGWMKVRGRNDGL